MILLVLICIKIEKVVFFSLEKLKETESSLLSQIIEKNTELKTQTETIHDLENQLKNENAQTEERTTELRVCCVICTTSGENKPT